MIVKEVLQAQEEATKYYELFEEKEMEQVDGTKVNVLSSIGKVNVTQLEEEKARYESQIEAIDLKLAEIAKLTK